MDATKELSFPPSSQTIERLEAATAEHAVTALASLDADAEQNRVRLKNLVHEVTSAVAGFAGEQAAQALRGQLEEAAARARPVQRPASLCVLTDGDAADALLLPEPFPACVMHDTRFYVRPLIQAAATHGEFLLLALAQGQVCLYRVAGEEMAPVTVDDLPGSLTDVVGREVDGGTLQHHDAGGTRFHGQGKGDDDRLQEIERFLRAVDSALMDDTRVREQHVMIAAVEEMAARFRHLSQHGKLMDETVTLSPDQTSEEDLRLAAGDAFRRWRERDNRACLEALWEEHHGQACGDQEDIVKAAEEGRIDTILVQRDEHLWGRFDPGQWSVELHGSRRPDSHDLVDTAMRATWRQGGRIRVVGDEADFTGPLQARLRY